MIVSIVTFKLPRRWSVEEASKVFNTTAPKYLNKPGLIRKHYFVSENGDRAGGTQSSDRCAGHADGVVNNVANDSSRAVAFGDKEGDTNGVAEGVAGNVIGNRGSAGPALQNKEAAAGRLIDIIIAELVAPEDHVHRGIVAKSEVGVSADSVGEKAVRNGAIHHGAIVQVRESQAVVAAGTYFAEVSVRDDQTVERAAAVSNPQVIREARIAARGSSKNAIGDHRRGEPTAGEQSVETSRAFFRTARCRGAVIPSDDRVRKRKTGDARTLDTIVLYIVQLHQRERNA